MLTLCEDNFISCVAYLDPDKLQLVMNLVNPRLSLSRMNRSNTDTQYACNVFGCNVSN